MLHVLLLWIKWTSDSRSHRFYQLYLLGLFHYHNTQDNTELQSARKIIQLLQDDLNGIKNQPPRNELTAPKISDAPDGWKTIAARPSNPSNQRYFPKNAPNYQKTILVIQTSNCFHVLHNLQTAQMETSYTSKRTPETQSIINQTFK